MEHFVAYPYRDMIFEPQIAVPVNRNHSGGPRMVKNAGPVIQITQTTLKLMCMSAELTVVES